MHHATPPAFHSLLRRSAAMPAGVSALLLVVLLASCQNDARQPPAEPMVPTAASTEPEGQDPDPPPAAVSTEAPGASKAPATAGGQPTTDPPPSEESGGSPDQPEHPPQPAVAGEYPLQDNPLSGCSLCHVDIEDEFVGTLHFEEKVGCITCHGPSEGHLADENNEVKPDEVFARADVDRLCEKCHECLRPKAEQPELTAEGQRKVCIDCHGPHDSALAADARPASSP
jgi:hypothetical protein